MVDLAGGVTRTSCCFSSCMSWPVWVSHRGVRKRNLVSRWRPSDGNLVCPKRCVRFKPWNPSHGCEYRSTAVNSTLHSTISCEAMVRRSNRDGQARGFVAGPSRFEGKLQMGTTPCIGRNVNQPCGRYPVIRTKHVECRVRVDVLTPVLASRDSFLPKRQSSEL